MRGEAAVIALMRAAACLAVPLVLLTSARAFAAPPTMPAPEPGFTNAPKPPTGPVSLQLENSDLGDLVRVMGELTGKRFVIASPKLASMKASVYAPQKVTVPEAYQAFLAVLASNGLTLVPQAGFYKIVESQDIARQLTPIEKGEVPAEERYVTRIHRLQHLSAEDVATGVLSKLATKDASIVPYAPGNLLIITETGANLRRMLEILDTIDEAGEEDKLWLQPLRYVPSGTVEKQLSEMLDLKKTTGAGGGALHVGRIVALDKPNALVIVATRGSYERILHILEQIDNAPDSGTQVRVVMLQHSDAKKIVGPINESIGGAAASTSSSPTGSPPLPRAGPLTSAPSAVLEANAKVSADESTNSLIVTATPRDFLSIQAVIEALDKPKRQVFIEAIVLDVSATHGLDLGVAWHGGKVNGDGSTSYGGFRPLKSAVPSTTDLQAFALGIRGSDIPFLNVIPGVSSIPSFGALITAAATSQAADILSTPSIMASDNTPAELKVQLNTSLQPNAPQSSILPTGGTVPNVGSTVSSNYQKIGPRIKVTPHLNDSDEVRLDVDEQISDVQTSPDSSNVYGTLSYLERSASTTLTVKDGETIVIGGLVRNKVSRIESKVPVLGDIPLLGALFRTRSDSTEKSNLMLILTPHIIRDSSDYRRVIDRKLHERQELMDHEAIFGNNRWEPPENWAKSHGVLSEIRTAQREVDRRRRDAEASAPHAPIAQQAQAPLELPVPQAPASVTAPSTGPKPTPSVPSVGPGVASKPTIIER